MVQKDYMTLSETAESLGKSAQTVRRMIKKGLLKAQRMRTPQGFNYVVYTGDFGANGGVRSAEPVVTGQNEMTVGAASETGTAVSRTANTASEEYLENDYYVLENLPADGLSEGLRTQELSGASGVPGHELRTQVQLDTLTLLGLVDTHHKEKMMLFHILEELQAELNESQALLMAERSQAKTIFGRVWRFFGKERK